MPVYVSTSCPTTGTAGTCWITTNCTTATATTTTNTIYWVADYAASAGTATVTATQPTWWTPAMDQLAAWTDDSANNNYRAIQQRARRGAIEHQARREALDAHVQTQMRQAERRQAKQLKQDGDAIERAHALLLEHLTPKQRQTFADNEWFIVEGGKSKTQYRIRGKGSLVANIDVMEQEKVKHRLCGHCDPRAIPLGDHLLAQKIMLEFAEDDFLRIANRHAA